MGALIAHLPQESAYLTAQRDRYSDEELAAMPEPKTHGPWSRSEHLLAVAIDALQTLAHIQISRGGVKQDPPAPVRRPGVVVKRREVNPQQIAYLERIRARHAEQREAENG